MIRTKENQSKLELIQKQAKVRHEKERRQARRNGRHHFPMLPVECSWAFEESFWREIFTKEAESARMYGRSR